MSEDRGGQGSSSAEAARLAASVDPDGVWRAVRALAQRTPLLHSDELSRRLGAPVWLKCECLQTTGSFKVRGAAARLSALSPGDAERGVVACSSGNHGRAVSYVADRLGIPATVYVPEWVDPVKLDGIRSRGAEAVLAGSTFDEAEMRALKDAADSGRCYVSAYDDPWVIAGQGTLAREVTEQLGAAPAALLAPLSGGGLLGGIAANFRASGAQTRVVAVSAERAAVMLASVEAGQPVELPEEETLASALAGGIGLDNRWSFPLIRDRITEHVSVTEDDISSAMHWAATRARLVLEGGGAVGLAAVTSGRWPQEAAPAEDGPIVIVLSGGNVSMDVLSGILEKAPA